MSMPDAHPTAADSTQQAVSGAAAAPGTLVSRFDVWQRHLLDLSLRNNMLNARVERSQIELVLPDIVAFEDSLADNKTFELQALRDDLSLPQDTDAAQKILHEEAARMLRKQALLCLSGGRLLDGYRSFTAMPDVIWKRWGATPCLWRWDFCGGSALPRKMCLIWLRCC